MPGKKGRFRIRRRAPKKIRTVLNKRKELLKLNGNDPYYFIQAKPDEALLINESFLNLVEEPQYQERLRDSNAWHAFIFYNVQTIEKKALLDIVMDFLHPIDFLPANYEIHRNKCILISFHCAEAVMKMCRNNLLISNSNPMFPIRCNIILKYMTLDVGDFQRRTKEKYGNNMKTLMDKETLNLDNFCLKKMPEYWPLWQPKVLYMILDLAKRFDPTCINLSNNKIASLLPLEALWTSKVKKLDLRYNSITNISQLETLSWMDLEELWLDGNPLCEEFDEFVYIKKVKEVLPKLKILDGVEIKDLICPAFRRNFLCDQDGFDLVNQFLEYYFPLYDSYRNTLEGIYHRNAMFSLTSSHINQQETSQAAELFTYELNSRNLLRLVNIARNQELLVRGAPNITRKIMELPNTEHDPCSFTVDLLYHKENMSVVSVSGAFREIHERPLGRNRMLGFNRTFVLTGSNGEYTIINEVFHIYNALTFQMNRSFRTRMPLNTTCLARTDKDREEAVEAIQLITGVKAEWAKRLLGESKNDLVRCLRTFMADFKIDKVPIEAFKKEEKKRM